MEKTLLPSAPIYDKMGDGIHFILHHLEVPQILSTIIVRCLKNIHVLTTKLGTLAF